MSGRAPGWLRIELLILVVAVAGAVFAWRTRGSRASDFPGTSSATTASPTPAPPRRPALRRRHASPLSAEATARSEALCLTMAQSQLGFSLKEPVTVEATDRYGVGDMDTGAGDSLIVEGIARTEAGRTMKFQCSMAHLNGFGGSPFITHGELR